MKIWAVNHTRYISKINSSKRFKNNQNSRLNLQNQTDSFSLFKNNAMPPAFGRKAYFYTDNLTAEAEKIYTFSVEELNKANKEVERLLCLLKSEAEFYDISATMTDDSDLFTFYMRRKEIKDENNKTVRIYAGNLIQEFENERLKKETRYKKEALLPSEYFDFEHKTADKIYEYDELKRLKKEIDLCENNGQYSIRRIKLYDPKDENNNIELLYEPDGLSAYFKGKTKVQNNISSAREEFYFNKNCSKA